MSGREPLALPADMIYSYDGSFNGFLCCVNESVYSRELPVDILCEEDVSPTFFATRAIAANVEKAARVRASILAKISARAMELVTTVFCSCLHQKELRLLTFLLRAYREGGSLCFQLGDADVAPLLRAEKHLLNEAHLLKGFARFRDVGGALVAVIAPKNQVLPFLAEHFVQRYDKEQLMIFDKTHRMALVCRDGKPRILAVDVLELPEISEGEARHQALWKQFYKAIAIEGRENPRCRMTHMPKRYWEHMLELSELVRPTENEARG
jgi:probable DNA metabolism protein